MSKHLPTAKVALENFWAEDNAPILLKNDENNRFGVPPLRSCSVLLVVCNFLCRPG